MSNQQCKAKFKLEQHNVHNVKIQGVTTFALNPTNAQMDLGVRKNKQNHDEKVTQNKRKQVKEAKEKFLHNLSMQFSFSIR